MAERRYNEASFGNPGRLTYLPYGVQSAEDCGWKTVRNHNREVPKLKEVSSYHEWVVPSCKPVQGLSDGTWHENRKQRKWLLKNYPEATLGNDKLEELLADEDFGRQSRPTSSSRPVQFDLGEMADTSDPRNVVGVPLLAMAAGSAGDVLRLISPKTFVRQLGHANPWMSELLDHNEYQQTLWTEDIGTIRRVKCVVHAKRFEPVRWLIVVRDSVTTVFQPEYQVISVAATAYSRSRSLPASHIFPNMLFRITKSNTGSDFHSDVAFNPGIKAKPPQLAIIDEGGNWTVWDITGTRNRAYKRPKLRLHHCGSIKDGFRKVISRRSTMWPQWHRILWIGRSDGGDEYDYDSGDDKSSSTPKPSTASYARSSLLALCNRHTIRILDLEKKVFLPDLQLITGGAADAILDIHLDDQDPRYFYVLTTTKLFVIAELPVHTSTKNQAKRRVSILQSIPHHRSKLDPTLRISVASRSSSSSWRTSTVVLHASNGGWLDVFHTTFSKKLPEQIQIHHDSLISKKTFSTDEGYSLQAVRLRQSPMTYPLNANLKSPASSRFHHTIQVYQIFTFGSDLSLNCCLAMYSASSSDIPLSPIPDGDVLGSAKAGNAPATLLPKTPRKTAKKDQERHKELRYLGSRFVITDAMMMFQDERQPVTAGKAIAKINYASRSSGRMVQPVYEHLRRIFQELREENDASSIALDIYEAAPFDPVFVLLQAALEVGSLPLKTIFQTVQNLRAPRDINETSQEWATELDQLHQVDPCLHIRDLVKPGDVISGSHYLLDIFSTLANLVFNAHTSQNPYHASQGSQSIVLRQVAYELYISRFGITYIPPHIAELPVADTGISSQPTDSMAIPDAHESIHSTAMSQGVLFETLASSRASTPASTAASSIAEQSTTGPDGDDRSVALIQALTGVHISLPKHLLAGWAENTNPSTYTFSIDRSTEITPGMLRRAKQQAREARKRKRTETLRQLQREHDVASPQTQPTPDARFFSSQISQPLNEFSQFTQNRTIPLHPKATMTMSQPLAGVFGGRSDIERPKKKIKRKGGF